MGEKFRIGLTRDFLSAEGKLVFKDIGLDLLRVPGIEYEFFDQHFPEVKSWQIEGYDGVISLAPRYSKESLKGVSRLAVIGRLGVGYEMVDLEACTEADVMVFISKGAVNRPVAEAIITLMLALSKRLFIKDRLTRTGRWSDKIHYMGNDIREKVLGSVGLGGIGSELFRLVKPFDMRRLLAHDPYAKKEHASSLGVELVDLKTLLSQSDYVAINCPLTHETKGLIGERELSLMKPTAYLINTARGGIVDQSALTRVLEKGSIAGAALDVFEKEPIGPDDSLLKLDNVILTPHGIAWTDELFRDNGTMDCQGMLRVFRGEVPDHVVNVEVLKKDGLRKKLKRYKELYEKGGYE